MSSFHVRPALDFSLGDLTGLFTSSFAGYFVPVKITVSGFVDMLRRDGADLALSRVLMAKDEPVGLCIVARRGWTSRVAAMGINERLRGQRAGSFLMGELARESRERGDRGMVLEVIQQNARGIRLYEKSGFRKVRPLVGFSLASPPSASEPSAGVEEVDIRLVAKLISQFGMADLPWQLSAESMAMFAPPARAYKLGAAYAIVTDPEVEQVGIRTLLVKPDSRHRGEARRLLKAMFVMHPGKTWKVPPIYPEEIVAPFVALGFVREQISQWQMSASW